MNAPFLFDLHLCVSLDVLTFVLSCNAHRKIFENDNGIKKYICELDFEAKTSAYASVLKVTELVLQI